MTTKATNQILHGSQSYGGLGKQQSNQSHSAWILSLMEGLENNRATTTFYRDSHLMEAPNTTTKQLPCSTGILVLLKLQKTTTKQLPILQGSSVLEGVDKPTAFYRDPHLMEALKTSTEQLHCKTFGACWSNANCFFTFKAWHLMKPKIYIVVMALASKWQEWCFPTPPLPPLTLADNTFRNGIMESKGTKCFWVVNTMNSWNTENLVANQKTQIEPQLLLMSNVSNVMLIF